MFPCEMARYIAGFRREARKYGPFWCLFVLKSRRPPPSKKWPGPPANKDLLRQLKLGEHGSGGGLVQRDQLGRSLIFLVGGRHGGDKHTRQTRHDDTARHRVMPLTRAHKEIISAARGRRELQFGLARKQCLGSGEVVTTGRAIGVDIRPDYHFTDGSAVELHVACTKRHAQTLTLRLEYNDARLSGSGRPHLLGDAGEIRANAIAYTARQENRN